MLLSLFIHSLSHLNSLGWETQYDAYIQQLQNFSNSKLVIPSSQESLGMSLEKRATEHTLPNTMGTFIVSSLPRYNIQTNDITQYFIGIQQELKVLTNHVYLIQVSPSQLQKVLQQEWVDNIEPDQVFQTDQCNMWGLDRLDEKMDCQYKQWHHNGKNSHVYVVDTGIHSSHNEFSNRLEEGANFVTIDNLGNKNSSTVQNVDWEDCQGHGTHVAGTVGGTAYGVAKGVSLHGVRVLSCSGSGYTSWIVQGMNWCLEHASKNGISNGIVSMSLGGGNSPAMKNAVNNLANNGMIVVVAAGNENTDACTKSPANAPLAITVGSTTRTDRRSGFSNYGDCVDIFAPGSDIKSAWIGDTQTTLTISGTSMATPHVSGVIALLVEYMVLHSIPITRQSILERLWEVSEKAKVLDSKTNNNYLLNIPHYNKPSSYPTPYPTNAPTIPREEEWKLLDILLLVAVVVLLLIIISYCCYRCYDPPSPDESQNRVALDQLESNLS